MKANLISPVHEIPEIPVMTGTVKMKYFTVSMSQQGNGATYSDLGFKPMALFYSVQDRSVTVLRGMDSGFIYYSIDQTTSRTTTFSVRVTWGEDSVTIKPNGSWSNSQYLVVIGM